MNNPTKTREIESHIKAFVADRFGSDVVMTMLQSGHHAHAYKLDRSNQVPLVLRVSDKLKHFQRDMFVGKRFIDNLQLPRSIDSGPLLETSYYYCLTEFISGNTLARAGRITQHRSLRLKTSFLNTMMSISSRLLDGTSGYGEFNETGVGEFKSWADFLVGGAFNSSVIMKQIEQQVRAGQLDSGLVRDTQFFLESQTNVYELRHLVHGDYQPHNLLVKKQEIAGVIDWGNAKFGVLPMILRGRVCTSHLLRLSSRLLTRTVRLVLI